MQLGRAKTRCLVVVAICVIIAWIITLMNSEPEDWRRDYNAETNMRELARAVHMFLDSEWDLPREGPQALHSWRVKILPYIGENDLYKEIINNGAWDSPANLQLLPRMPKVFMDERMPLSNQKKGMTHFQAFGNPGGWFESPLGSTRTVVLAGLTEGWSEKYLLVETRDPVPWTKPGLVKCTAGTPLSLGRTNGDLLVLDMLGDVRQIQLAEFNRSNIALEWKDQIWSPIGSGSGKGLLLGSP